MLIATIPLLVAVVGTLMFALTANAKLVELGRALMWCGVLVALFVAARHTIAIG